MVKCDAAGVLRGCLARVCKESAGMHNNVSRVLQENCEICSYLYGLPKFGREFMGLQEGFS